ncbi:neurite extension and migration factor isoform X1 [Xyrauchen texanus]|uniref:neurite extension and migration factor isoform X1 n=2 Tax=Xyrauchen texanus TaxID=154827 RepID=UPI002241F0AF|nr:neurite extension and migration factor isoform X1 [Xyrauchen texanus]
MGRNGGASVSCQDASILHRLDSGDYVRERDIQFRLMDVLQESRFSGADHSPCPRDTSENEPHDTLADVSHDLRRCDDIEPAVLSLPSFCDQNQTTEGPLSPADLHDGSISNTTSLSSLSSFSSLSSLSSLSSVPCSKPVTPWSVPQTCDRSLLSNMDSRGGECLSCLIPKNQTESESCDSVLNFASINLQCIGPTPITGSYGDQVLSDQLLSGPAQPDGTNEGAEEGRSMQESESDDDPASRSIYEGLGEEAQDWSCLETLISESRMELLDLCSRSELAVNLFCEEDVENYMFQEEETALSGDVCSLKIRYESYQDGVHERSDSALQNESQLGFFPSLPCSRKEGAKEKPDQPVEIKADDHVIPNISQDSNFLFDLCNSPEDSGEFSDDSSCTGSPDHGLSLRHGRLSRENSSSSSQLSYRLRAKRKVAYREDYLYDVDSIESERNAEKCEKQPAGLKKERDDDWSPKKRRRSNRKEPPVIIKYIIINRFKGQRHMRVRLGQVDPSPAVVSLSPNALLHYEKLAPLKAYWQKREQEQQEKNRLTATERTKRLNGCKRPPRTMPKRKHRMARLRIQQIHAVENSVTSQTIVVPANNQLQGTESLYSTEKPKEEITSITYNVRAKSRTQEREERRKAGKTGKIKKFKSEARLRLKKLIEAETQEVPEASDIEMCSPCLPENLSNSLEGNAVTNETSSNDSEKCTLTPTAPGTDGNTEVLPGGYLQTLLEASESSSSANITCFHPGQQNATLQPIQSCVLSPPSESEFPHSPPSINHGPHHTHYAEPNLNEPNQPISWPSQPPVELLPFSPDVPTQSPVMPSGFPTPLHVLAGDGTTVTGYGQVSLSGCRVSYEDSKPDADYGLSPPGSRSNNSLGRLVSFNSLGSLSATSSNYSSLSLREGEREREEEIGEINDGFLSHCSPRLILQQSLEEVAPLRESTDLLDISNFTPDKFRHSSLSEMSPPDTPNSSPQLLGNCGKAGEFSEAGESNAQWSCGVVPQLDQDGTGNARLLQIHPFKTDEEEVRLGDHKVSMKKSGKNGQGTKKAKTAKTVKGEKVKLPCQGSRSVRKIKALLEGKVAKSRGGSGSGASSPTLSLGLMGPQGEWHNTGGLSNDDQREFQEPSNILSNIVSGMAEVQRFMRASAEPLWGPCLSPGQHALQSQTLKILGSAADLKKRGGASGGGRGKKGAGRGGKTLPKLLPPGFFSPLGLDCLPLSHRPAHKKMYRHKSSAKFAREELLAGKRDIKGVALTALVEKRSYNTVCVKSVSQHHRLNRAQRPALSLTKWLPSVQGSKVMCIILC